VVMELEVVGYRGCWWLWWVSWERGAVSDAAVVQTEMKKKKPYLWGSWRGCGHQIPDLNSKSDDDTSCTAAGESV
jgi:hypothetical protein